MNSHKFHRFVSKLIVLIAFISIQGCTGLRSAKGLEKGAVAATYVPPIGGNIRVGVTDQLELRGGSTMLVPDISEIKPYVDLFYHKTLGSDFSIGGSGGVLLGKPGHLGMIGGFVVSKEYENGLNPYLILQVQVSDQHMHPLVFTGFEWFTGQKKRWFIIPEIGYSFTELDSEFYGGKLIGGVGIGYRFRKKSSDL